MTAVTPPIEASWTIHRVLDQYPNLLDDLVSTSPAFHKLRNPLMRRVQARLVTVEQAARIGGVEPQALLDRLNRAAGVATREPGTVATAETPPPVADPPSWLDVAPVTRRLDVRPMMARGEEPFRTIMATARDVQPGDVLQLTVGFEPVPLYDALTRQGFSHWARQLGPDTWQVDFHRDLVRGQEHVAGPVAGHLPDRETIDAEVTIDVSELVPPEPMVRILETLAAMPAGSTLLVHHVRRPIHLYERLDEMGYPHHTRDLGPGRVDVLIRKSPIDAEAT